MATKRLTTEEARKQKGQTDWSEVDALSDEEINKAAKEDADSALPTEEELKQFKRIKRKNSEK